MDVMIEKVTKTFGGKKALDAVSMHLGEGIHGLLGPNGAGKTTLMRLLATLLTPSEGKVTIDGIALQEKSRIREAVGYLPQEFAFYPGMSVQEALDYLAVLSGMGGRLERKKRIAVLLEQVNLQNHRKTKVRALSGGMKRRLGVAQAMIHEPRLLIVDEPTAGLDPEERVRFRHLLNGFAKGRTILLSTHVVEDVESTCEQVTVLRQGTVRYHGPVFELNRLADGRVWSGVLSREAYEQVRLAYPVLAAVTEGDGMRLRLLAENQPFEQAEPVRPSIEDGYFCLMQGEASPA
ncbi:ABC transporter ATP-binding protein [Gorillibacterium massiliense]|uniref:ABC transporter ATP-binding protein n=1 Tax=Gorillibacterium massiliense TaxID=1280390 RepID=UPI0004B4AD7D|nr:ABC transporter ATP-binding protein [Gorillibacterium massiliense]